MDRKIKIVIVGAGFGGIYTYLYLHKRVHGRRDVEITIINKTNYFLFTPLLHEVATGSVRESNVLQPVRSVVDACLHDLIVGEAREVDLQKNIVTAGDRHVPFDYVVVVAGARTRMFNFSPKQVLELKDLADAWRVKNRIIGMFDLAHAEKNAERRRELLTFVIIGGGPTGVELAGEISEFVSSTLLRQYPTIGREEVHVVLVHAGAELVTQFDVTLRKRTRQILERQGVELFFNTKVAKINDQNVVFADGTVLVAATKLLVAGVEPNPMRIIPEIEKIHSGQFVVNEYLHVSGFPQAFVLGDMAAIKQGDGYVPQTAQAAVLESEVVAENILALMQQRHLTVFRFRSLGDLVSLGRYEAVANILGVKFSGPLAWWIWRSVYAFNMIGFAQRLRVLFDWTMDIFYSRDASKTGE